MPVYMLKESIHFFKCISCFKTHIMPNCSKKICDILSLPPMMDKIRLVHTYL
jgi:hypothetical protein